MATIGLDKLFYAKITEDNEGIESYGTPSQLAKAMTADLSVELAEATLYADDGASEIIKEFKSGTLSLGVDDIGPTVASDLTGATIDKNGVVVSAGEDGGEPVAIGFRAKKSNGKYKYFWLYKVKFGTSTGGDVFKNGQGSTVLTAVCYQAGAEIDADGKGTYTWTKYNKDGAIDTSWGTSGSKTGKTLSVSNTDVDTKATFMCVVTL